MNVDAFLSHREVDPGVVRGRVAIVVDVVRATTTIVEALASGARAIVPALSVDEAIEYANTLGREDTILCGERRGLKVEGFDLGNSPGEFTPARVRGRRLVMSTTNGTRSFRAAQGARAILTGSFANLSAAAARAAEILGDGGDGLVVVCAGKEERFGLDDAVCAGHLIRAFQRIQGSLDGVGDGARACLALAERFDPSRGFLEETAAGQALVDVGLADDLEDCARVDRRDVVPAMTNGEIGLVGSPA